MTNLSSPSAARPPDEPSPVAAGDSPHSRSSEPLLRAAVRGMRPRQWLKNVLVFTAPLAAGALLHDDVWLRTLGAFVVFCLVASGIYLVNDARDVEEDRRHPIKCERPIASGALPLRTAWVMAAVLLVVGLTAAFVLARPLGIVVAVYVVVQIAYSAGLKHQPVLDLVIVASGFLLRAIAGGVASDIPLSQWFLLVASFGSLFMVAGKRYSEIHQLGQGAGTRRSLDYYSESYLRFVWSFAAAATIGFYSLWAFQRDTTESSSPWAAISIAPLTIALLRYAVDIDRGLAGSPEHIVVRDKVLQALGLLWILCVGLSALHVGSRG